MASASRNQVITFLKDFKTQVVASRFHLVRRCLTGIISLGLTIAQAEQELLSLSCEDYGWGPSPDHNQDGTLVWVFGKLINGKFAYIKIKLHPERGAICMSFKKSDRLFNLPYR